MEQKARFFLQQWFPKEVFQKRSFPDAKTGISIDYINERNNIFTWVTGGEESYIREDGTTQRPQTPKNLENKLGELLFILRKWREMTQKEERSSPNFNPIKTIIFFYNLKDQTYYTRDFISIFWDIAFDLNEEKIIDPDKDKKMFAKLLLEKEMSEVKTPYFVTSKIMDVPAIKGSSKLAHDISEMPLINQIWRNMCISRVIQSKSINLDLLKESVQDNINWLRDKGIGKPIVEPYERGDFETLIKNLAIPKLKHLFAPEEWYLRKSAEKLLKEIKGKEAPNLTFRVNYGGDFELPNMLTRRDSPLLIGGPGTDEDVVIELAKDDKSLVIGIQMRAQSSDAAGKKNYLNDCRRLACRNFLLRWNLTGDLTTGITISRSNILYFVVLDGFWSGPKDNPRKGIDILANSSCPDGIFFFNEIPILLDNIRKICLGL